MKKRISRLFCMLTAAALCTVSAAHVPPIQTAGAYSDDYYYDDDGEPYLIRWDYILLSIANHNNVVIWRLRSSLQSHYVALAEGV